MPLSSDSAAKPTLRRAFYPLADALLEGIGEQLDAGESERELFKDLAEHLWTGNFTPATLGCDAREGSRPHAAKARLERLLINVRVIREKYQTRLHNEKILPDLDFKRPLTEEGMKPLHNAWMNDVESWMSPECLEAHQHLIEQANELERNRGKCKGKGSGGKDPTGVYKSSTEKFVEPRQGPRQQAQQLKKQRFNKIVCDLGANKNFLHEFPAASLPHVG